MDLDNILYKTDHTQLSQTATWEDIKKLIDEAIEYKTESVVVPPSYVKRAAEYAKAHKGVLRGIGTVIGFPNGYSTTETKVFETKEAIANGAKEITMVININEVKNKNYYYVEKEISQILKAIDEMWAIKKDDSRAKLTVIIETSLLTEEEKIEISKSIPIRFANYIQNSTGFIKGRVTFKEIKLLKKYSGRYGPSIKVAGEIESIDDAFKYLKYGARNIFTSRLIDLVKQEEAKREKFTIEEDVRLALDCLEHLPKRVSSLFDKVAVLTAKNGEKFIVVEEFLYRSTNYVGERAFRKALAKGIREFSRIVISGPLFIDLINLIRLYVMLDYCDPKTFEVVIAGGIGEYEVYTLKELLKFKDRELEYDSDYYRRKTNYGNEYNTNYANSYGANYTKIRLED